MNKHSVVAVVIWYHPSPEFVKNIGTYEDLVDEVIVVDNSPASNQHLISRSGLISYHWVGENRGIAGALNIGCRMALEREAEWILTMDQDSAFDPEDICRHLAQAQNAPSDVAILSPGFADVALPAGDVEECDSAITSGSLLRSEAFRRMGGYNEDLFMDEVDHEFGYRLRRAGYRILRIGGVFMRHQVGDTCTARFLWRRIRTTNHSHVRRYYMTRSRLYMRKQFPEFGCPYLKMILTDAVKIALVENDKTLKLFYMLRGVFDHFLGVKGRLEP